MATKTLNRAGFAVLAGAVVLVAGAVGTGIGLNQASNETVTHLSGSRADVYHSIDELIADSSFAVQGTVSSQTAVEDAIYLHATHSTLDVSRVIELKGATQEWKYVLPPTGSSITIVQPGTREMVSEFPLLEPGVEYLLFVVARAGVDPSEQQYYITGVTAGAYAASPGGEPQGEGDAFTRAFEGPDVLPDVIEPKMLD